MKTQQATEAAQVQSGQHTPLPWTVAAIGGNLYIQSGPDTDIALIYRPYPHEGKPFSVESQVAERAANARLIAAAPELLDFANQMVQYLELKLIGFRQDYPEDHCIVQTALRYHAQAIAAIAKATATDHSGRSTDDRQLAGEVQS